MNKAETYTSKISENLLQELTPEETEKIEKRMLLAAKIDNALKSKGWKQKDFAESLNKQPSEITKWLSGTHNFTTDTLWDIERVLGVELVRLEEKSQEQVISFHLSINKDAEIKKTFDYGQLYYGSALSIFTPGQKKIIRQYGSLKSYQA